jgi:protein-S-isoprenylcysteine O-methyltransferase Ste14
MNRMFALFFGIVSYLVFFVTFIYAIGFVGDVVFLKSINSGTSGSMVRSLFIDAVLLGLFAIPHSVMARPGFKRWWTRIIPEVIERSTYVLVSSLLLAFLFWQWQPIPYVIWEVTNPVGRVVLQVLFWMGWAIVVLSTFLISHFNLFGLRQVYLHQVGKPSKNSDFRTPGLYKLVRHPLMLGFIIAFWSTPKMTFGHLIFAVGTTTYILIALQFEERDLVRIHGNAYESYRERVFMLLPLPKNW